MNVSRKFPQSRLRRTRFASSIRSLVAENSVSVDDLIQPIFVKEDLDGAENIDSLPGISRYGLNALDEEIEKIQNNKIKAVAIFPVINPDKKDETGSDSLNEDNLVCTAIKQIKKNSELAVIADVALDPYTSHGHDGVLDENGYVENSKIFIAEITLNNKIKRLIKNNQRLRIHINTDEVLGRIQLINNLKKISPGETHKVVIRLEKEIPLIIDDLFILRFYSPQETIGGGKVFIVIPLNEKKFFFKNLSKLSLLSDNERLKSLIGLYKNDPKPISKWKKFWSMSLSKLKELFDELDLIYFGSNEDNYISLRSDLKSQQNEYLKYF